MGGMEQFARDLYGALCAEQDVRLIKWGGSNKYLPLVLPYFFFSACWLLVWGKITIIHMQDGVLAPVGYVLSRLFRRPFTVVLHGLDITNKSWLYQMLIPRFVAKADVVFCISHATAAEAIQRGVSAKRVRVVPLGVIDEYHADKYAAHQKLRAELGLPEDAPILLTVGRLVERKGVAWFVEYVMPKLLAEWPAAVYLVVGSGSDKANVRIAMEQANLGGHIRLLGAVSKEMLATLYNGADVFVQPNIVVPGDMEGFGLVLLEASLCELPVVAAGVEGIRDAIIDGENGVLVVSGESQAFVRAIGTLLKNSKRAQAFGASSRKYTLAHFQWETIAKQYILAYKTLTRAK